MIALDLKPGPISRALLGGFCYWLVFLLILEPDNVLRAVQAGGGLIWSTEVLRIVGASLIGCLTAPLLLGQVRRFPILTLRASPAILTQLCLSALMAVFLIAVSCVLAPLLGMEHRPFATALTEELVANGPLVFFAIGGFLAIAHAARFFAEAKRSSEPASGSSPYLTWLPVKSRQGLIFVEMADVDWIETQGNYLELHCGEKAYLIRESLAALETRLDPKRFVRIHRRTIIASGQISAIRSLGAGDGVVSLKGGAELRLSRTFRSAVQALIPPR